MIRANMVSSVSIDDLGVAGSTSVSANPVAITLGKNLTDISQMIVASADRGKRITLENGAISDSEDLPAQYSDLITVTVTAPNVVNVSQAIGGSVPVTVVYL